MLQTAAVIGTEMPLPLVQAMAGDLAGAHEHLRRAIELEPRNRIMARQDADFAALAGQPQFQALLSMKCITSRLRSSSISAKL